MAKQATPYRMTALSDIKPYERNPRIIPQAAVDAVARSIQAYGFRQPIVVDKNGVILAGHTRYRAAQQLGMTEVPVVWQTDITDVQARGYRIADNKVAELSAWDRDALAAEVRDLASICDDDLDALGLADWELDRILAETETDTTRAITASAGGAPAQISPAPAGGTPYELFADTVEQVSPVAGEIPSVLSALPVVVRIAFPDVRSAESAGDKLREIAAEYGGEVSRADYARKV